MHLASRMCILQMEFQSLRTTIWRRTVCFGPGRCNPKSVKLCYFSDLFSAPFEAFLRPPSASCGALRSARHPGVLLWASRTLLDAPGRLGGPFVGHIWVIFRPGLTWEFQKFLRGLRKCIPPWRLGRKPTGNCHIEVAWDLCT